MGTSRGSMIRWILSAALLFMAGCCDSQCDCRTNARGLVDQLRVEMYDQISPISTASPAGVSAQYVLRDPTATQERKAQALQLLFELERAERFDQTVDRLNGAATKLEIILERKVEAEEKR
jgi:hypothetical protein